MKATGMQEAALALGELQEDSAYKALAESRTDMRFNQFRQDVDQAQIRCFQVYPPDKATPDDVRRLLEPMLADCLGTLAPFRPFVARALAALD